jgi:hypothetical protein
MAICEMSLLIVRNVVAEGPSLFIVTLRVL